jgi:hypothetical protein
LLGKHLQLVNTARMKKYRQLAARACRHTNAPRAGVSITVRGLRAEIAVVRTETTQTIIVSGFLIYKTSVKSVARRVQPDFIAARNIVVTPMVLSGKRLDERLVNGIVRSLGECMLAQDEPERLRANKQ